MCRDRYDPDMPAQVTRLSATDFARLIHRHNLDEAGVRDAGIIVPKAFAADVVCAADDEEKRVSEWVISTATEDRIGDTIKVSGWKLTDFRKGGSILFAHNRNALPVGRPLKVWKDTEALRLRMEHASAEANPIAEQVFRLVLGGFLRGNSVGFRPLKWEFMNEDEPWNGGIRFLQQELLEDSIVPVPANADALLQSVGKGLDVDMRLFTDWQRMALDGEVPSLGAYKDDIAASLKALTGNPVSASVPGPALTAELPEHIRTSTNDIAKHAIGLANALGALDAHLGIGEENPHLTEGYRKSLNALTSGVPAVAQVDKVGVRLVVPPASSPTESAGGAVSGLAASQPPAESAASSVDTESERGAETMDLTKQIDALAKSASDGDTEALEQLRALAVHVNAAAKALADADPEDVFVFELDDDDEGDERSADTDDGIVIEVSEAEFKAAVAKQVAQTILAQTGRI